jgi:hypothetical protein
MDWLPTVAGSIIAALIAATALLLQARWNRQERKQEWQHQREMAESEHQRRIADLWRERRLEAHAQALTALERLYMKLRAYSTVELMANMLDARAELDFGRLDWAALDELSAQSNRCVSELRLVSSDTSLELAIKAYGTLAQAVVSLRMRHLRRPEDIAPFLQTYVTQIGHYQSAARDELGTAG